MAMTVNHAISLEIQQRHREYPGIFCCNRFGAGDVQFASAKME